MNQTSTDINLVGYQARLAIPGFNPHNPVHQAARRLEHRLKMDNKRHLRSEAARKHRPGAHPTHFNTMGEAIKFERLKEARIALRPKLTGYPIPGANLSQYHPDFGMTPVEHEAAKAERAAKAHKANRAAGRNGVMSQLFGKKPKNV